MRYEVYFVDRLDEGFGGKVFFPSLLGRLFSNKCYIKILSKYKNDTGLLKHELKHVEQFYREWFYNIRYKFSKTFRYRMELEAYTEQIMEYKYTNTNQCNWVVESLINKYSLDKSKEDVIMDIALILKEINNG